MKTNTAIGIGVALVAGAAIGWWGALRSVRANQSMSGYSPPPYHLPPEYTSIGPGEPRVPSGLYPGQYDPRKYFYR